MDSVQPHLADLVARGRRRRFDIHSLPLAVGSKPVGEMDEAPIRGSGRSACFTDNHSGDGVRRYLSRAHERRSMDVCLLAVPRLGRVQIWPARVLRGNLHSLGNRRRRNGAQRRAVRPRNIKRFAASPANFS